MNKFESPVPKSFQTDRDVEARLEDQKREQERFEHTLDKIPDELKETLRTLFKRNNEIKYSKISKEVGGSAENVRGEQVDLSAEFKRNSDTLDAVTEYFDRKEEAAAA